MKERGRDLRGERGGGDGSKAVEAWSSPEKWRRKEKKRKKRKIKKIIVNYYYISPIFDQL